LLLKKIRNGFFQGYNDTTLREEKPLLGEQSLLVRDRLASFYQEDNENICLASEIKQIER